MATKPSLEYLAGIIDGEGCVCVHVNRAALQKNKRPRVVIQMTVANTNKTLLEDLQAEYGGSIHLHLSTQRARPEHKPSFNWTVGEQAACALLLRVRPFLRIKGPQADLAMELGRLKRSYSKKGRTAGGPLTDTEYATRLKLAEICHLLNKRGQ